MLHDRVSAGVEVRVGRRARERRASMFDDLFSWIIVELALD
jgi:hypothetical protein